jgi:hypothetical protein
MLPPFVRRRTDGTTAWVLNTIRSVSAESHMYFGGGILGTILVLFLIVYFLRRA